MAQPKPEQAAASRRPRGLRPRKIKQLRRRATRRARRRWWTNLAREVGTALHPKTDKWDEFTRAQWRRRYRKALRYGQIGVLCIAVTSIVFAVFMVVGCFMSDLHIDRHYATAYARVEAVERTNTYVSFTDRNGKVISPDRGVFYPTGVHTGQQVRIDYDYTNPNFARISGRSWVLSFVPALSVVACVLPWCLLAYAVFGRYRLKAGGLIRRTHWKGSIAGIHINTRPTIMSMRASTAPTTKQVP